MLWHERLEQGAISEASTFSFSFPLTLSRSYTCGVKWNCFDEDYDDVVLWTEEGVQYRTQLEAASSPAQNAKKKKAQR